MRIQYVLLLGLILFQGVFTSFSTVFPYTAVSETIPEGDYSEYNVTQSGDFGGMLFDIFIHWGVGGLIAIGGLGAAILTKNYVFIGVGLFIGILSTLYIETWRILSPINVTGNPLIGSVIALLAIAIGILTIFSLVDMFAPQGAQQ